jgi:hypothetical protein
MTGRQNGRARMREYMRHYHASRLALPLCITGFVYKVSGGQETPGGKKWNFFATNFWFCDAMPPEWHWVMPLGMPLLLIIVVAVPVTNILH